MASFAFGFPGDGVVSVPTFGLAGGGVPISDAPTNTGIGWQDVLNTTLNDATKAFGAYQQTQLLSQQISAGQRPSIVQGPNGVPQGETLSQIVTAGGPGALTALGAGVGLSGGTLLLVGILLVILLLFRR